MSRTDKTILRAIVDMDGTKFLAGMTRIRHKGIAALKAVGAMGAAGGAAWAAMVKSTANYGDLVAKTAKKTGLGTDELQRLMHAAKLSAANLQSLDRAVKRMNATMLDAANGSKMSADAVAALGLDLKELQRSTPEQRLAKFLEALAAVEDQGKRSALAQKVFGRAGTDLLPMLSNGARGLRLMKQEAARLGLIMPPEQTRQAEDFNDALYRVQARLQSLVRIGTSGSLSQLAEILNGLAGNDAAWSGWSQILDEASNNMTRLVGEMAAFAQNQDNIQTTTQLMENLAGATGIAADVFVFLMKTYVELTANYKREFEEVFQWLAKHGIIDVIGRKKANRLEAIDSYSPDEQEAAAYRLKAKGITLNNTDKDTYQPMLLDEIQAGRAAGLTADAEQQKAALAEFTSRNTVQGMEPKAFYGGLKEEIAWLGGGMNPAPAQAGGRGDNVTLRQIKDVLEQRLPEAQ